MTGMKDKQQNQSSSEELSATIYLNKIKEFSEGTFSGKDLDADAILNRTLQFILEMLHMDCAFYGEFVATGKSGGIKGIKHNSMFSEALTESRLDSLTLLTEEAMVITVDDEGGREVMSHVLDGFPTMSAITVPIECEDGCRGVLAVCATEERNLSVAKVLFVKSMASVVALFLQALELMPNFEIKHARQAIEAKRVWEGTVDALNQLVVVLDENADIMRANMAVEHWQLGSINSYIHQSGYSLVSQIAPDGLVDKFDGWQEIWNSLPDFGHIVWKAENKQDGNIFRFSLRTITNKESKQKSHKGYAVLVVEDITQSIQAEEKLRKHNTVLEDAIRERNIQLEDLNQKLTQELEEHRKNKIALLKSEAKYIQLFNNTLAAVCLLNSGRIQFCNDRFCQIFKYKKTELVNSILANLFDDEDRGKLMSLFADLEVLKGQTTDIAILKAWDGYRNPLWLELRMEYLNASSEKTIIVNIFDITPQKSIELSLRRSEERLQKLSSQLISAQENERKRLARELHDGLGQSLSAIKYTMEDLMRERQSDIDEKTGKLISKSIAQIRQTIDDARRMAMDLRPSILDDLGIISTINWFCRQYEETYRNIKIEKEIYLKEEEIAENRKIVIYRILQEALNNVAKHAHADKVSINLQKIDEFIGLCITDNGIGMNKSERSGVSRGMGINSMQERVELSGGSFRIAPNEPHGTIISIRWPSQLVSSC